MCTPARHTLTQKHYNHIHFLWCPQPHPPSPFGAYKVTSAAVTVWQQVVNDLRCVFASGPNNPITPTEVSQHCQLWATVRRGVGGGDATASSSSRDIHASATQIVPFHNHLVSWLELSKNVKNNDYRCLALVLTLLYIISIYGHFLYENTLAWCLSPWIITNREGIAHTNTLK